MHVIVGVVAAVALVTTDVCCCGAVDGGFVGGVCVVFGGCAGGVGSIDVAAVVGVLLLLMFLLTAGVAGVAVVSGDDAADDGNDSGHGWLVLVFTYIVDFIFTVVLVVVDGDFAATVHNTKQSKSAPARSTIKSEMYIAWLIFTYMVDVIVMVFLVIVVAIVCTSKRTFGKQV